MARYLVTGGAGFIGSAIARRLLDRGHDVVIVDNLTTGSVENVPEDAEFIRGDCQDPDTYSSIPKGTYEGIYHLAGQSSGEISFDNPVYDLQTNTQSTLLLLKVAAKLECHRFLYASSMSVYGDQPDRPVGEDSVCSPKSFYGVGKLASEHYLRIYQGYGTESTALRLFNVFGPGQNLRNLRQGMVSIFLAQALESRKILVKGDAGRFRDFVYIQDVVDAFLECEKNASAFGKIYNVGSGKRTTVSELLQKMTQKLPYDVETEFRGSTPGDQFGIYADTHLIRKEVGWEARYSLDRGLAEMVNWAMKLTP